ncbi:penicillin-binding transpeptidase domain-containing protein [Longimycelium tulufanense]|uniref:penicillin-binding transpeptidase domain-containing protein n=1 Tax=Longimycelium tulufanense TaxID=907463 RepID=UPI00166679EB|nr:penicillin-binding transpeptidase domain-containing protein [Longimycelium tulufanense]
MRGGQARHRLGRLLVVGLLLPAAGCGLFRSTDDPGDTVQIFFEHVAKGDTEAAAKITNDEVGARDLLDRVRGALRPAGLTSRVEQVRSAGPEAASAEATVVLDWDLGEGRHWSYQNTVELRRQQDREWRVHWLPTVVHPKLAVQQTVAFREQQPELAPVLDRDGAPLLSSQKVVTVLLNRKEVGDLDAVSGSLARSLQQFDERISQQSVTEGAQRTPEGQAYAVAVLREPDYQRVKPDIYDLPGVRFTTDTRLLGPDRNFGSRVLPAIRTTVRDHITGKPGWRVVSVNAAGAEVETLHEVRPQPAEAVSTSLSRSVQAAAEDAVETVPQQSVVVAIQPSTGNILAVAQNSAADNGNLLPWTGRYPPGSTFKIVTATAALQAKTATADTVVPCPGSWIIQGYRVPNINGFALGNVPLHTAFAQSCNTTFAQLAKDLPADALTNTARQLGLGVDFEIPGVTTVTGAVPPASDAKMRAVDGFGQGKVVASPFGMALVVASVANGTMPTPTLIRGMETKADAAPEPLAPEVADAVRAMMRRVVTEGTASRFTGVDGVHGKTGTAEFGDGSQAHGWFVGFRGDLAFATFVAESGSSVPAIDISERFLRALG